jgi:hypothetical protein
MEHSEEREKDVQRVCRWVLSRNTASTGDYGRGGECPFCYVKCWWDDDIKDITHKPNCVYLIAKDLTTNMKKL